MKVAILGQPQAGQAQLFSLLTGISPETIQQRPLEAHPGICEVRDPRLKFLSGMYKPKKTVPAKIEFVLLPDLALEGPAKTVIMTGLKDADAICWVSRRESAEKEVRAFISELIIADLMLVEKRIENIEKAHKKKASDALQKEKRLMEEFRAHLEKEKPLSQLGLGNGQLKEISAYQFLTLTPVIIAINVPEDAISGDASRAESRDICALPCIRLCASLEEEISRLDEKERREFMEAMGIAEPALDRMTRLLFEALGYMAFFTVGDDEVRAWPLRKGSSALDAAHAIHSDIARGFIRAEVMKYVELTDAGSERVLKEQGKMRLKGKEYPVEDGDIISVRFSV